MGCDIHMYVEYKKDLPIGESREREEKWVYGDYFMPNPYYRIWPTEPEFKRIELKGSRNYSLFSTLAGVRDYSGDIKPVSDPKGIPDDCCPQIKEANEDWKGDGHTHSWLTLKEIKEYQNGSPTLPLTGIISPSQILDFNKGIMPQSWCQGTNQEGWERRNWTEKNETLLPLIAAMERRAKELMQSEWNNYNPENDDKIRIVFWFDN